MPKRLRGEPIYLAPEILAYRDGNYNPQILDERRAIALDPNNIDDKILIYKRQVEEWFLKRAQRLCRRKVNDFLVVMIAVSYIEGVEQYRKGEDSNRRSQEFFSRSVRRIFNIQNVSNDQISSLYKHLRCGLFHNGMSGDAVVLNRKIKSALVFSDRGTIDINPKLFLAAVVQDFNQYLNDLDNDIQLRDNFSRMFSVI